MLLVNVKDPAGISSAPGWWRLSLWRTTREDHLDGETTHRGKLSCVRTPLRSPCMLMKKENDRVFIAKPVLVKAVGAKSLTLDA